MVSRIRRVGVNLTYDKNSIELDNYLLSMTLTDNLSGVIDSIDLVLNNQNNMFFSPKFNIQSGEEIKVTLWTEAWNTQDEGIVEFNLGTFYIDSRKFSNQSLTLKALSIPLGASQDQVFSKTWGEISLKDLNKEFADKFKIGAYFSSNVDPKLFNLKQERETDLSFLLKIADQEGLNFKVSANKLVLFNVLEYEKRDIKYIIDINNYKNFSFNEKTKNIYTKVEITSVISKFLTPEKIEYSLKDLNITLPGKLKEKVLKVNCRSKSKDLKSMAKNLLLKAIRDRVTFEITIISKMDLYAGDVIFIKNAGIFTGKYMISKTVKKLPGFTMNISAYKILEG